MLIITEEAYRKEYKIFNFDNIAKLDISIIILPIIIIAFSLIVLYSAGSGSIRPWALKQGLLFLLFYPIMLLLSTVNIRILLKFSYIFYFFSLLLLLYVTIFGHSAMGATRWIDLKIFKLQPSELMKVSLVFALARYFHKTRLEDIYSPHYLIIPLILILVPALLVLRQPDLGTAVIILILGTIILFVTGVRMWKFGIALALFVVVVPIIWNHLHDYQKQRVYTFLSPEDDPLGSGYNIIQSKIAIGSGGLTGKGLLNGSQGQLDFLPERHTDFIFTMMGEEFGFLGSIFLLILYSIIIIYAVNVSIYCHNHFSRIISFGLGTLLFLHVAINSAMTIGLLPVVGVPLPLFSYGGSMVGVALIAIGLIMNMAVNVDNTLDEEVNFLITK